MPLLRRLGTSLTVVLLTTLPLWALGSSTGVQGATDAATGPVSSTTGHARPDPLGVVVPSSWRPGFVPAMHAVEPSVLRPVPRLAPPAVGTTVADIPATALAAYQRAATVLAEAAPSCRLPWTLLAGVGRVESDHGLVDGARLDANGVSHPRVIGVPLNGAGRVAKVRDTDGGSLDGDRVWDRAVGPLQFIPTTWATVGVDADGDGRRSPDDIDDAALAAGVYLCAGTSDLDLAGRARAALLRFNNSSSYAALVLAYAESYRSDSTGPLASLVSTQSVVPVVTTARRLPPDGPAAGATGIRSEHALQGAHAGAAPAHAGDAAPGHQPSGAPSKHHAAAHPPATPPSEGPGQPPAVPPGDPEAPGDPAPPAPEDPPATDDPEPPAPSEPPTEEPAPPPEPQVVEGTWTACDAGSCLDGRPLDLAGADPTCQVADYDGDGGTEPLEEEVAGLRDQIVAVTVLAEPEAWLVLGVRGLAWPGSDTGCVS